MNGTLFRRAAARQIGIAAGLLSLLARAAPAAATASSNKSWDVVVLIVGLLFLKLGLVSLLALYAVLRPQTLRASRARLCASPRKTFITGILAFLALALLAGLLRVLPGPLKGFTGGTLLLATAYWTVGGLAAVALEVGERLQANLNGLGVGSDAAAVIAGGALLMLVGFLVGFGQVVEIVALLLGLGAAITGLGKKRQRTEAAGASATATAVPPPGENPQTEP
ncbi:MAG: hypothetical protein GXP31_00075 [Kiritimatiellaeota bacterium]|nr:hypothetical protein [Kiritimatiellota bacterium]